MLLFPGSLYLDARFNYLKKDNLSKQLHVEKLTVLIKGKSTEHLICFRRPCHLRKVSEVEECQFAWPDFSFHQYFSEYLSRVSNCGFNQSSFK